MFGVGVGGSYSIGESLRRGEGTADWDTAGSNRSIENLLPNLNKLEKLEFINLSSIFASFAHEVGTPDPN